MTITILGLPLGNAEDISLRALDTLKTAQNVICEDTRYFNKLWQKLHSLGHLPEKFTGKFYILNDFNEKHQAPNILNHLNNQDAILVSDAGLPTISDPGFNLINEAINQNINLNIIPGPTALTTALAISGFSSDKVLFLGFLPKKTSKRNQIFTWLNSQVGKGITVIFYESPYKLQKTLNNLSEHLPLETSICITRELTKPHQETIRTTLNEAKNLKTLKGEITFLLRI